MDFFMATDIRIVSTYPPAKCGLGRFSRDLATALQVNYTGEVGAIKVAAINDGELDYGIPVDLVIEKNNTQSWRNGTARIERIAHETKNDTVILMQHEYGLDSLVENGRVTDCRGNNYVSMAEQFAKNPDLITLVYLHTVLGRNEANDHQVRTLQNLAKYSDGLVVTTKGAVDILREKPYGIPMNKLKHIDHGIRINKGDRLKVKRDFGAEGIFLAAQLGLRSPGKGDQYVVRGVAKFVNESLTDSQRESVCCLIAGEYHPSFVAHERGVEYEAHKATIEEIFRGSNLESQEIRDIGEADFRKNDIVFLNNFVSDSLLKKLYCAMNVMVMPYLDMAQISSGIGADTLGSGRVPIATGFRWMREMLGEGKKKGDIEITDRGIIVESGEDSVLGVAQGLDYLVFNKKERLAMEASSYERGHEMRWDYVAGNLLRYVTGISKAKRNITGRGVAFEREKESNINVLSS